MLVWIDTAIMIADPLTKQMQDTALAEVIRTGVWNIRQPTAAVLDKVHKQLLRSNLRKRAQEAKAAAHSPEQDDNQEPELEE